MLQMCLIKSPGGISITGPVTFLVHGPESENLPPLGNFRDPPSFLPEGVLYSFPGVVKHINAANMQK